MEVLSMGRNFFIFILVLCCVTVGEARAGDTFIALSYHDVRDNPAGMDGMAVTTNALIEQFSWLREHGYHPVSIDDILDARAGKGTLPMNAVLLTFDDGLESMYTKVFPLLKIFHYPAVVAVTGKWLETGKDERVTYGDERLSRDLFLTWDQLREMAGSGLVEVASHSYDLHRTVVSNPQGSVQPVVIALEYDRETGAYQSLAEKRKVLREDFWRMASLMKERIGVRPRVMAWPYGFSNDMAVEEAMNAGISITMGLESCINHVRDVTDICRELIRNNPSLDSYLWELKEQYRVHDPVRVVQIDMDYIYDDDKDQQRKNLDMLLDRIKEMKINTVYLQAFSDTDGDGAAEALYFPNRHMPVREDLFNRVAWQLRSRAGVNVYAWMPVLAFQLEDGLAERLRVRAWEDGNVVPVRDGHNRLSPFYPETRKIIGEIYEDLAAGTFISGILFHDDAYLTDSEDAGPEAIKWYEQELGVTVDPVSLKKDPALFELWSKLKTRALAQFTDELTGRVRKFQPHIRTARNMYAGVALDQNAEKWLAQSMEIFLDHYDYTVIMAMPYLEGASNPFRWLKELVATVSRHKNGLRKTVFELQSVRWDKKEDVPERVMRKQMRLLQILGAVNFGYYPDDFISGHPDLAKIKPGISLETYPYKR